MSDLIFLSLEQWDDIWRRNQFLASRWARRFPSNKVLFVGPWKRATRGTSVFQPLADAPNLSAMALPKLAPNSVPVGRRLNQANAVRAVRSVARQQGLEHPLLWVNPVDCGFFIERLGERGVVYDITDDWELVGNDASAQSRIRKLDRELCRRAELTVVCSPALYESRKPVTRRCFLLQNGVDFEHYIPAQSVAPAPWPRPVLGFTGSIHPNRIDLELLSRLSREFAEGTIWMIGPVFWPDDGWKRFLDEHPNIQSPGARPWALLPELMAGFDICIVPHLRDEFTDSLNPLKLWEYLACGKPIVSTPVAGFRDFSQHVRLAATSEEFAVRCHAALEENGTPEGEAKARARREEARKHSWDSRFEALLAELRASLLL